MDKLAKKTLKHLIKAYKSNLNDDFVVGNSSVYEKLGFSRFTFEKQLNYLKQSGYLTYSNSNSIRNKELFSIIYLSPKAIDLEHNRMIAILKFLFLDVLVPIIIGVASAIITNLFL